jgi:hypothetical protein
MIRSIAAGRDTSRRDLPLLSLPEPSGGDGVGWARTARGWRADVASKPILADGFGRDQLCP